MTYAILGAAYCGGLLASAMIAVGDYGRLRARARELGWSRARLVALLLLGVALWWMTVPLYARARARSNRESQPRLPRKPLRARAVTLRATNPSARTERDSYSIPCPHCGAIENLHFRGKTCLGCDRCHPIASG